MKKPNSWTPLEIGILEDMFPTEKLSDIAKRLNRSEQAIQVRAYKMGLRRKIDPHKIQWNPQMLKLLTTFFPTMFNKPLAKWIGVSQRTMIRKARELGLEKQEGFLDKRRKDINALASEALRKKDSHPSHFRKGVRFNPDGEFKKGHKESEETKAKRIQSLKESWRRRKLAQVKYY